MSNDEELALRIEVHGTPIPQPRPRFVDGRAVSTAGPRAKRWKHAVIQACEEAAIALGEAAIEQIGGIGDAEGGRGGGHYRGVSLEMEFRFPVPAGKPERVGRPHGLRPDSDNLAKLVMDSMQAAGLLKDDGRVADLRVRKVWATPRKAGCTVVMRPMDRSAPERAEAAPGWLAGRVDAETKERPV